MREQEEAEKEAAALDAKKFYSPAEKKFDSESRRTYYLRSFLSFHPCHFFQLREQEEAEKEAAALDAKKFYSPADAARAEAAARALAERRGYHAGEKDSNIAVVVFRVVVVVVVAVSFLLVFSRFLLL